MQNVETNIAQNVDSKTRADPILGGGGGTLYLDFNLAILLAAFNGICVKVTHDDESSNKKTHQQVWQCPHFFHIPLVNSLKVRWLILCLTRKDGSFSWMLLPADSVLVHSPRESPNYRLLAGRQTHWQPFVTNYETPSAQVWRRGGGWGGAYPASNSTVKNEFSVDTMSYLDSPKEQEFFKVSVCKWKKEKQITLLSLHKVTHSNTFITRRERDLDWEQGDSVYSLIPTPLNPR